MMLCLVVFYLLQQSISPNRQKQRGIFQRLALLQLCAEIRLLPEVGKKGPAWPIWDHTGQKGKGIGFD